MHEVIDFVKIRLRTDFHPRRNSDKLRENSTVALCARRSIHSFEYANGCYCCCFLVVRTENRKKKLYKNNWTTHRVMACNDRTCAKYETKQNLKKNLFTFCHMNFPQINPCALFPDLLPKWSISWGQNRINWTFFRYIMCWKCTGKIYVIGTYCWRKWRLPILNMMQTHFGVDVKVLRCGNFCVSVFFMFSIFFSPFYKQN